ncbi:NACHT, LRR and PYD domains-containing protein 12-like [Astyanax mexicanus]|uniref:NACHT, LRR and PYD domains-containing protein 12-like n=1 Tax=Astyanax mexicanus TaxID=7994 RepID=A0A8T2M3D3_ASTMX|nr:NACHT, LRR and PYD domains-containing protein 12-like [Astyanax mexicanus]
MHVPFRLNECNLTERSCSALCRVLSSETSRLTRLDLSNNKLCDSGIEQLSKGLSSSTCKLKELSLTELDLSNNNLQDSGVKNLCKGLSNPLCKLEILRLKNSEITEKGCAALSSALESNPSHLIELDLSGNKLGNLGVEHLSHLLKKPECKIEQLRLAEKSNITEKGCNDLAVALCLNPSHLIELDLSENNLGNSGVNQLCLLLSKESCNLQKLE